MLRDQIRQGKPIIRTGVGTGISAKFEEVGNVDLIVMYKSGRFRMVVRRSLAGLLRLLMQMILWSSIASITLNYSHYLFFKYFDKQCVIV